MTIEYTYITFATEGEYTEYGKKWLQNMQKLSINAKCSFLPDIEPIISNKIEHKKAIGRKIRVAFIIECLKKLQKPIVWMDCDDALLDIPKLPEDTFDFGYVENTIGPKKRLPFIAGFLVFHPTKAAFHFLKVWNYLCAWDELEPMGGNHIRLIHAFNICNDRLSQMHRKFIVKDVSTQVLPHWKFNGNRL